MGKIQNNYASLEEVLEKVNNLPSVPTIEEYDGTVEDKEG